jgi:hypothetical protein
VAIYVSSGARRRRLIIIAAVALVAGLALGFGLGRATAPDLNDAINDARSHATEAATTLQRLPIEYQQAVAGRGGESSTTITDAVTRARTELARAVDRATWLGTGADDAANKSIDDVEGAVKAKAPLATFEDEVAGAVATIKSTFGLPDDAVSGDRSGG